MNAGGRHADEHIPLPELVPGNQVLLVHRPHGKSGQVILVLRVKARHLRRLTADEGRSGLAAPFRHSFYDSGNLLRHIFAAGNVVQEEQGLSSRAGHVVDAHGYAVDAHRVMLIHQKSQLQLGSHSVRSGQQGGLLHVFQRRRRKRAGKTADAPQDLGAHGSLHILLHQLHRLVAGLNVNSRVLIIHSALHSAAAAARFLN